MIGRFALIAALLAIGIQPAALGKAEPPARLRVAGIVLKWLRADREANFARIEPLIRQAAAGGADIICTTESFLDGYSIYDKSIPLEDFRSLGEPIPEGAYFQKMSRLADELGVLLIVGLLERDGDQLFNTAVVVGSNGELLGKYHKQRLGHESVRITAGSDSSVFETPFGRLGVMICADRRDPDVVSRFCERGAELLICPSGGMFGPKRNDPIVQERSRENDKYIVFVHPAEFLVTAPDGSFASRTILGDQLDLKEHEVNEAVDRSGVFYFDFIRVNGAWEESRLRANYRQRLLPGRAADHQLRRYLEDYLPPFETPASADEWDQQSKRRRERFLDTVVFRGDAAQWRQAPLNVEWFDAIQPGNGYRIKKFRYEALPGFWIPALLYEPTVLADKAPIVLNVNGHHRGGKAMDYKQRRCINLAKRGILSFNLEFIDQGQLHDENDNNNKHNRLVQLDLCGTSGVAPFYLTLQRGLDAALTHPHADPMRVGVTGLSGGGWQTIWLAALDERITLANPVAGYCSILARVKEQRNVGDAEQIPTDLCVAADYTHLTAMMAPRPLLLTYNAQDDCCFVADKILPELRDVGSSVYRLYGEPDSFQTHVNTDPGDHNYDQDNREAFYRFLDAHGFFAESPHGTSEIQISHEEILTGDELAVPIPKDNATLHSLALHMCQQLPLKSLIGASAEQRESARARLAEIVRFKKAAVAAEQVDQKEFEGITVTRWQIHIDDHWTLPVVEMQSERTDSTVVLISDEGRLPLTGRALRLAKMGRRVIAADLLGFGELEFGRPGNSNDDIVLHMAASVGQRPLGIQAAQLAALAKWCGSPSPVIAAEGPRSSTIALVAAALEKDAIAELEVERSWASWKDVIRQNLTAEEAPELFCFGLLREFDIPQVVDIVGPRLVRGLAPGGQRPDD